MKTARRNKFYTDQNLLRDIGFLMIAAGFVLMKGFDMSLQSAVFFAPVGVLGSFAALLVFGFVLTTFLRILEKIEIFMGVRRGAKY